MPATISRSILDSVKHICGIEADETHFDEQILAHLNGVIFTTEQLGLIPKLKVRIESNDVTWEDLYGSTFDLFVAENYIGLKVRELFDPPTNSSAMEALHRNIQEYEWRICAETNKGG